MDEAKLIENRNFIKSIRKNFETFNEEDKDKIINVITKLCLTLIGNELRKMARQDIQKSSENFIESLQ